MNINPISTKDLIKECISFNDRKAAEQAQHESAIKKANQVITEKNEEIINAQLSRSAHQKALSNYSAGVKNTLLAECIYKIYSESFGMEIKNDYSTAMRRNLVNQFVKENGAENILRRFRTGSELLSELAVLVDSTYKKVLEGCDDNAQEVALNADFAKIDPQLADDFFDRLDDEDTDTASAAIKQRVADAITEFIDQNVSDKQDIKDVLSAAQEKIDATSDEKLQESYQHIATRRINDIRGKKKNVFGAMVQSMSEAVLKSDILKKEFMNENSLDMDLIVERVTTLYTFIETLNTIRAIDLNEEYIDDLIKSLKSVD